MSVELVALAVLMAAVTYPSRALPLLVAGVERLPPRALLYLRLVGPAVLAALAAVNTVLVVDERRHATIHPTITWLAVPVAVALAARTRNLFVGLVAAVALSAVTRATGLA